MLSNKLKIETISSTEVYKKTFHSWFNSWSNWNMLIFIIDWTHVLFMLRLSLVIFSLRPLYIYVSMTFFLYIITYIILINFDWEVQLTSDVFLLIILFWFTEFKPEISDFSCLIFIDICCWISFCDWDDENEKKVYIHCNQKRASAWILKDTFTLLAVYLLWNSDYVRYFLVLQESLVHWVAHNFCLT